MPLERRINKMRKIIANRQRDLTVVCENIHDPHNVSAIFRSCEAIGIPEVHLLYNKESFPELAKKTSASAKKWIDVKRYRDYSALKESLKEQQMNIYATVVSSGAKTIYEIDWTKPSAIIMGNEHRGVSNNALKIADYIIYIPMFGMIESLNVSVATSVILYEACRQRIQSKRYPFKNDVDEWLEEKLKEWIERG